MRYLSPLRYPGGKARLAPFFGEIIKAQTPKPTRYAEPFAGGAGAALRLLRDGTVSHIHINDINPGIAAFWRSVTTQTSEFVGLIKDTPVTIEQWHCQHAVYEGEDSEVDDLTLGFATFFLNRTNRSGILDARPIGGFAQQGNWRIDARYNIEALVKRVEEVGRLAPRISVTEMDARVFLATLGQYGEDIFVYADPPYVAQGAHLYLHAFNTDDHEELAATLLDASYPWILTYDDDEYIWADLYAKARCARFDISHTAQHGHIGSETLVYGPTIKIRGKQEVTPGVKAKRIPKAK